MVWTLRRKILAGYGLLLVLIVMAGILGGAFSATRHLLETATQRAEALAGKFTAYDEPEPYTAVGKLVARLTTLRCH